MQVRAAAGRRARTALVLSGGGARGAYEAGVLSYLLERVYPHLGERFEFDVISGTSVGAIHAAYFAAGSHLPPGRRAAALIDTWRTMTLDGVLRLSVADLVTVPLRALGLIVRNRNALGAASRDSVGGLVDVAPLERLVAERIEWHHLAGNLASRRPGALCVSCTNVRTGRVAVFLDGPLSDTTGWTGDSQAQAIETEISERHVRASAAIPFLFPAVRIEDSYYLDGGLRANTPLSPALRLGCDRLVVVTLKQAPDALRAVPPIDEYAVTQPAFLLGKMLDILMLDQVEHELRILGIMNELLDATATAFGEPGLRQIQQAIKSIRGLEYRRVQTVVIRPSEDIGAMASEVFSKRRATARGIVASMLAGLATRGAPGHEADLLSYLYFDSELTIPLIELGRSDAQRNEERIAALLLNDPSQASD